MPHNANNIALGMQVLSGGKLLKRARGSVLSSVISRTKTALLNPRLRILVSASEPQVLEAHIRRKSAVKFPTDKISCLI